MAGSDVYTRMEEALRRQDPTYRSLRARLVEIGAVVFSIFVLGFLLYVAQFSGTVRWYLGFIVIVAVATYTWRAVAKETLEPKPMVPPAPPLQGRRGELSLFTAVVRRANQGLPYSQMAVSSRARDAFEERARLARGLNPQAMRNLERDPGALRTAFRDPSLAEFLYLPTSDSDARYRWVSGAKAGAGFSVSLDRILDRMEEWR